MCVCVPSMLSVWLLECGLPNQNENSIFTLIDKSDSVLFRRSLTGKPHSFVPMLLIVLFCFVLMISCDSHKQLQNVTFFICISILERGKISILWCLLRLAAH